MAHPAQDGKKKRVYVFAPGSAEGAANMATLLGGKGANLAEMARLGLPVPPGFTITTGVSAEYANAGGKLPDGLASDVDAAIAKIGETVSAKFGDVERPLLVSVRSGSRASMPGMMDTILNLGLNDQTVEGLAKISDDVNAGIIVATLGYWRQLNNGTVNCISSAEFGDMGHSTTFSDNLVDVRVA